MTIAMKTIEQTSEEGKLLSARVLPAWWRVLPSLTILMIIGNIDGLILNDFIEYRFANFYRVNSSSTQNTRELCLNATRIIQNSTTPVSTTTSKYPISTTMSWDTLIQSSTARLNVYVSLASTIPGILVAIWLGANCDRTGRKSLITLPYFGKIIRYFILTATSYYNLSDTWIILAAMFDSCFGGGALNILASFAYVTDCTTEKSRTAAIVITDVFIACSQFVPLVTIGIYLQNPNFLQCMIFTLLLGLVGLVFCIVLQPESNLNVQHLNIFQQLKQTRVREVTKAFSVFFVKRQGHKQRSLIMLVAIHLSFITMICGFMAVYYLYLYGSPFCMDSLGVSLNGAAKTVLTVLLTIPFALTVLNRTDHLILPALACAAYMAQLVLFGVAQQIWMLYLAVCIGAFFNVLSPVIRSRITKLVEPSEYAVVFILAGVFESGGWYAISALANEIYGLTLGFYPGFVYIVFTVVGLVAIVLIWILYILERPSSAQKNTGVLNE